MHKNAHGPTTDDPGPTHPTDRTERTHAPSGAPVDSHRDARAIMQHSFIAFIVSTIHWAPATDRCSYKRRSRDVVGTLAPR